MWGVTVPLETLPALLHANLPNGRWCMSRRVRDELTRWLAPW